MNAPQMSKVNLLNLTVSCELDVFSCFACDFLQFFYILITFGLTTVFKKPVINGLTITSVFSIWYHIL
jgi:hypothetical protein